MREPHSNYSYLLYRPWKYSQLAFCYSEEAEEYIEIGALNGLFVLGRSMGFIGK